MTMMTIPTTATRSEHGNRNRDGGLLSSEPETPLHIGNVRRGWKVYGYNEVCNL